MALPVSCLDLITLFPGLDHPLGKRGLVTLLFHRTWVSGRWDGQSHHFAVVMLCII